MLTSGIEVNIKVLTTLPHFDPSISLPQYMTREAAGADICACLPLEQRVQGLEIRPGERLAVPTGLIFEIPHGYEVQVRSRSGLALKSGIVVLNSPGTIDADYRGEIKIILANISNETFTITHGMRIAQIIVSPVIQAHFSIVDHVSETKRSAQGFGSTGLNHH